MDPDTTPSDSRVLLRAATAGVGLSALTTAATFTDFAAEFTFLRYPLLGASLVTVATAGLATGRLPAFNRTLWAHAPWWARVSWLAIIAAILAAFATISLADTVPRASFAGKVLETRGLGAVAAYFFLLAGLRRNVDLSPAKSAPADDWNGVG
jgi:hypothetical protein